MVRLRLQLRNQKPEVTFTLPLNPANVTIPVFADGEFEVTLLPDDASTIRYAVQPAPRDVAAVQVLDKDSIPEINITPKVNATNENAGPAVFTITATGINIEGKTLKVRYTPTEVAGGSFLSSTSQVTEDITFTDDGNGIFAKDISIALNDDDIGEATGQIAVVLNDPASTTPNNQFYSVGSQSRATMTIYDDNAPELSIANPASGITEGRFVNFPVTAKISPEKVITVRYRIDQPGTGYDFVASTGIKTTTLDFAPNRTERPLFFSIINDNRAENNGIVRVTLLPDNTTNEDGDPTPAYTVSSVAGENVAEVMVTDNDPVPVLTLEPPVGPIAEHAGYAEFVVTSTKDLGLGFVIRYDPSEVASSDFLNGSATPSENQEDIATYSLNFIEVGTNLYSARLRVPIHNDNVGETTGKIQVELLDGNQITDRYTVVTTGEKSRTQMATIYDDDAPEITINSAQQVVEAVNVQIEFPITAKVSPNKEIDVYYIVSESPIQVIR